MSDTAAFFANKKKKKKAFKFNANLVDASTVTHTTHVDAPALSYEQEPAVAKVTAAVAATDITPSTDQQEPATSPTTTNGGEQWDDEALAATLTRKGPAAAATGAELLDMKSLDTKRNDHDNIAEKLRVEETKAQLAAAREGMERQAAKLKEEAEKKEEKATAAKSTTGTAPRFGAAAAAMGSGGGSGTGAKWVPPHLRSGGGASLASTRSRMPGASQKLDTQNEELFPDLATADTILEKQQKEQPAFKAPKKTPVGGGASWASKMSTANKPQASKPQASPPEARKEAEPEVKKSEEKKPEEAPKAESSSAAAAKPTVKRTATKKKKKDLSTFKPSS